MTRQQQDVAGCKIMIQTCSSKKTIRRLVEPDPTMQPQMKILECFRMNKNNLFRRQMNALCHKCVLAQPSCIDETQLELAARWGHVSNNPSFSLTLRSPRSAEPGAGLLTPVLRARVTKPSCHQGSTRTERGTNTSTGHPAGIFQHKEVEQLCHPLGTGQSLSRLIPSRGGDRSQREGDNRTDPPKQQKLHLSSV